MVSLSLFIYPMYDFLFGLSLHWCDWTKNTKLPWGLVENMHSNDCLFGLLANYESEALVSFWDVLINIKLMMIEFLIFRLYFNYYIKYSSSTHPLSLFCSIGHQSALIYSLINFYYSFWQIGYQVCSLPWIFLISPSWDWAKSENFFSFWDHFHAVYPVCCNCF